MTGQNLSSHLILVPPPISFSQSFDNLPVTSTYFWAGLDGIGGSRPVPVPPGFGPSREDAGRVFLGRRAPHEICLHAAGGVSRWTLAEWLDDTEAKDLTYKYIGIWLLEWVWGSAPIQASPFRIQFCCSSTSRLLHFRRLRFSQHAAPESSRDPSSFQGL